MAEPKRILIVRPSALGDVCKTVPVLASLRRAFPEARIDWLVQDTFADAVAHHPGLDRVILFDRAGMGRRMRMLRPGLALAFISKLRKAKYELVLDCQGLARSSLFTRVTGARKRIGHADVPELAWLGYNIKVDEENRLHTVDRMLSLVKAAGVEPVQDMRLFTSPASQHWALQRLGDDRPVTVIAPTSRWSGKRWPKERFAQVAKHLLDNHGHRIAIVAGPGEENQCGPVIELAESHPDRVLDLIGTTSIGQLMGIIERASLLIANDSAALHMAVGFDRSIIALFGPTSIEKVGPYLQDSSVIQHITPEDTLNHKDEAAGQQLMNRISTDEVIERIDQSLS